jgi:hypothetical protein
MLGKEGGLRMDEKILNYRKGQIIVFISGCYSDYSLSGFVVAIEDIDLRGRKDEFLVGRNHQLWDEGPEFVSWLIAKGLAMPVEDSLVHLGDYEFKLDD